MMSEMDANRSVHGTYEEQQRNSAQSIPPYEIGYQPPSSGTTFDDNFIEAVSQRIAQQMAQQSQQSSGKVYGRKRSSGLPAGLRGAIAIVSVVVLIPIVIPLALEGGFFGLLSIGLCGLIILFVNAIANGVLSSPD